MQKVINVLAVLSFVGTAGIIGGGTVVYLRRDAIIEQVKENVAKAATEAIAGAPSFSQVHHTEQPTQQAQAPEKKEAPKVPLSDETEFNLDVPSFLRDLT